MVNLKITSLDSFCSASLGVATQMCRRNGLDLLYEPMYSTRPFSVSGGDDESSGRKGVDFGWKLRYGCGDSGDGARLRKAARDIVVRRNSMGIPTVVSDFSGGA
jgi:hypothetical protein